MSVRADHMATTIQRHGSVALRRTVTPAEDVPDPFNTDEWDPARGAFWQHMMAGSFAGLAEHTVMFPVDTLKTHMQVLRSSPASTIQELVGAAGVPRLWRGVQSVFAGVIPAHAAYFSIYECCKPAFKDKVQRSSTAALIDSWTDTPAGSTSAAVGSGAAVCVATAAHDLVMTPTDVVKQRLQLGLNQNSISQAVGAILREQGPHAFVVALPVTLSMNLPYAALMGASNEVLRQRMTSTRDEAPSAVVHMIAGAGSGAFAAAITAPLDAVKTRLQTQHLSLSASGAVASAEGTLLYGSALEACKSLYREGGLAVFFRGAQARVLAHAPTVAICWTSYEGAKRFLETTFPSSRPRPDALTPTGHTSADAPTALAAAEATEAVPLVDHMIAGSIAGIVEHAAVFPIDTIKTHVQTATAEEAATLGTLGITRSLIRQHGVGHLLRGLSALIPAIGPAHALMFSGYEYVLKFGGAKERGASAERVAVVGACAGVVSTVLHDSCMVPAETIKQRLQLGYYRNAIHCFQAMLATGGGSFFRSLPTTLAMNVPYCSLMMMSNESMKRVLNPSGQFDLGVFLVSGGVSGAFAAGLTTPLDVVKTRLQVQTLHGVEAVGAAPGEAFAVRYSGSFAAVRAIHAESGFGGFWRGLGPRVAMFGPSCAISWVAYESCKSLIARSKANPAKLGFAA